MNILYVSNLNSTVAKGYAAKISGQIQSLSKEGLNVEVFDNSFFSKNNINLKSPIKWRISLLKNLLSVQSLNGYKFIYFRYLPFDIFFIYAIFNLRMIRNCDIVVEIPTFPYRKHILKSKHPIKAYLQLFFDSISIPFIKLFVSRIILISNNRKTLFGVKVLNIRNGVNFNSFPIQTFKKSSNKNNIVLLFVGNESFYHGLDLLIIGLKIFVNSNPECSIRFRILLVGNIMKSTKDLISNYKLSDYVQIVSPKYDEELNNLFNIATFCIGTLASKRLSKEPWSPLKHREYCVRGVPFVYDGNDPDFINSNFALISKNDSFFDFKLFDSYFLKTDFDLKIKISHEMRQFAIDNLSWDVTQTELINYYKTLKSE
jgi:glycosyltransferase involved in cell wall biosynthesis